MSHGLHAATRNVQTNETANTNDHGGMRNTTCFHTAPTASSPVGLFFIVNNGVQNDVVRQVVHKALETWPTVDLRDSHLYAWRGKALPT